MWPFKKKSEVPKEPECDHDWRAEQCDQYMALGGPRTLVKWKCQRCGRWEQVRRKGLWAPEDFD